MSNREDILKRILLNMKYDSSKTLSENTKNSILEQKGLGGLMTNDEPRKLIDTKEYWEKQFKLGKISKETLEKNLKRIRDEFEDQEKTQKNYGENESDYYAQSYISYQTVIPGQKLVVPDTRFSYDNYTNKFRKHVLPLKWHDKNTPYNQDAATRMFSKACKSAGYFIDEEGNQCTHLDKKGNYIIKANYILEMVGEIRAGYPAQITIKKGTPAIVDTTKKVINIDVYFKQKVNEKYVDTKKTAYFNCGDSITLGTQKYGHDDFVKQQKKDYLIQALNNYFCENSRIIDFSKNIKQGGTYDKKCKVLEYDVCLKWSWKSLMTYGGVDKGLKAFRVFENKEKAVKNEGVTYAACIGVPKESKQKWPWYSQYVGFYDESKYVKPENPNAAWGCPETAKTVLPSIQSFVYGTKYNKQITNEKEKEEYIKSIEDEFKKEHTGKESEIKGWVSKGIDYTLEYSKYFIPGMEPLSVIGKKYKGKFDKKNLDEFRKMMEYERKKIIYVISNGIRIKGK